MNGWVYSVWGLLHCHKALTSAVNDLEAYDNSNKYNIRAF